MTKAEIFKAFKEYMIVILEEEGIYFINEGWNPITDKLMAEIDQDYIDLQNKQDNCKHNYEFKNKNWNKSSNRYVCNKCKLEKWTEI